MIQYIYTTTKICVPDTIDICNDFLWNVTYVQGVDGMKKISIIGKDEINLIDVMNLNELSLKCFSGEPQLEKILDDGEILTRSGNFNSFKKKIFRFFIPCL